MNKDTNEVYMNIISEQEKIEINEQSKLLWYERLRHFYHKDITKYYILVTTRFLKTAV